MPQDHGWDWEKENVIKDNAFHRRVSNVRQQLGANINEADALEMIQNPNKPNPFSQQQVVKENLSDEEIDLKAFFDTDTPTYNFRYALRTLTRELARAIRYKRPLSVCVVVIDHFVEIFHAHGVLAIENVIANTSELLIRTCRADVDLVGRYGEDRFLLLLPETPGQGAAVLAERLRAATEAMDIRAQWNKVELTVSIGIGYYPGVETVEELVAHADLTAEIVMDRGGNGVCWDLEAEA